MIFLWKPEIEPAPQAAAIAKRRDQTIVPRPMY